jgi:NAD(P)-dependent dehydrogenase (short-subunit alcohol dehydrogenase family)
LSSSAGKRVIVTGAGGGLGLAMAKAFADEGATVGMLDVNKSLLETAVGGLPAERVRPIICDVSNRAAVISAIDGFARETGGIDVLVNNAVYFHYGPLVEMPEAVVDKMIDSVPPSILPSRARSMH